MERNIDKLNSWNRLFERPQNYCNNLDLMLNRLLTVRTNVTLTEFKIEFLAHVSDAAKWDIAWKAAVPRPPWRLED